MSNSPQSIVRITKPLPSVKELKKTKSLENKTDFIIIYDKALAKYDFFKKWKLNFLYQYPVQSGEKLKTLESFSSHIEKILPLLANTSSKNICFVAVGGGSVGDFVGFLASVYKRGASLVHIPSTWLAAMDSAHGGKTALNVGEFKNQVGTFYPADAVFLSKSLLMTNPKATTQSALGELYKMAFIEGGTFYNQINKSKLKDSELIWKFLPMAIKAKDKIVKKDPYEQRGPRQVLNLGHTLGHVIESNYKLPHGTAVAYGLRFSLNWSHRKKLISDKSYQGLSKTLNKTLNLKDHPIQKTITPKQFAKTLMQDKKSLGRGQLNFIFLKGPGRPVRRRVEASDIVDEAKRQGWL